MAEENKKEIKSNPNKENLIPEVSPIEIEAPTKIEVPVAPILTPTQNPAIKPKEATVAQFVTPIPIPAEDKSSTQAIPKNVGVETYIKDMNRIISDNKDGLLKKVLTEQEKFEDRKYNASPQTKKNKKLMFISLFFAISAIVILTLFMVFKKEVTSVDVQVVFEPFIFTDTTQFKEINGFKKDEIAKIIREEAGSIKIKPGEVEGIYFTENKNVVGLRKFLQYIDGGLLPGDELFINDNFLLGLSNRGTNDFFMILKIRSSSFIDVFKAMQTWESKLFYDLHSFFGIDSNPGTDYLNDKSFDDGIVDNKNARVLYDRDCKIVLMYVFVDTNYVVITNTEGSADEIIRRLSPGEIKQ